jgi:hypothetical protein
MVAGGDMGEQIEFDRGPERFCPLESVDRVEKQGR